MCEWESLESVYKMFFIGFSKQPTGKSFTKFEQLMRKEADPHYRRVLVLFSSDSGNASKLFSFLFKADCELVSTGSMLLLKSCCTVTDAEIFPLVKPAAMMVAVGTLEVSTARLLWVELVSDSASPCFCVGS